MRQIKISVLAMFLILPAFADARLPVVNLAAGGVSARAAFGEPIVQPVKKTSQSNAEVVSNTGKNDNKSGRSVVARTASTKSVNKNINVQKDNGDKIVAGNDVLVPRRPSYDLWAQNDAPLRLPQPEEFSVIKSDFELPEESLDGTSGRAIVARNAVSENTVNSVKTEGIDSALSEIEARIARLNELQRRAEESVQKNFAPVQEVAVNKSYNSENKFSKKSSDDYVRNEEDIKLSRLVVPMEEDVVVRAIEKAESPRIMSVREDMTKMSPTELRKAFRKTFLSENKHLSTFQIDDRFDVASDMTTNIEGFTSSRDLSETNDIRPLEIKIKFRNDDSALSRANYTLLSEYASIIVSNPTRAIQISIPESATRNSDEKKLAARRLAIVEQVLRDNGVSEQRILPVLSQRDEEGFVLRMISLEQYETLTQKQKNMFGDTVNKKTYKSMSW